MKKKTKQIIALIALVAFVFFTVFSTVGLVMTVRHSCVGIHCRTCERITVVQEIVRILKQSLILLASTLFISEIVKLLAAKMPPAFFAPTTVTLKTKLNS